MVLDFSRLHDKHVIVTGASAGIGAATGILFAKAGANVTLVARRADKLEEVKKEAEAANKAGGSGKGGKISAYAVDLSKIEAIDEFVAKVKSDGLPPVDILINNAGGVRGREEVGDIDPKDVDIMFDLNVRSLIHLTQHYVREFKKQNSGHIVNISSIAGKEPYAGGSIYTATKFAVHAFTASMMRELVNTPIRVSEVQPGLVETEFSVVRFRGDQNAANAVYKGMEPLTGQDIAENILFITSRPTHVNVAESFVLPSCQGNATLVHRN